VEAASWNDFHEQMSCRNRFAGLSGLIDALSEISIGIFQFGITLTPGMYIKSIIALFMGLVFQLSQVQSSSMATGSAKSCGVGAQAMSCCEGLQSCPCLDEGGSNQTPALMIPAAVDLKPAISQAPEQNRPAALFPPPTDAVVATASWTEFRAGYSGVPLSVAFCRFVI
jgi:hypothetical protein